MVRRLQTHLVNVYEISVDKVTPIEGGELYRVERHDGPDWVARPFPASRPLKRVEGDVEVLRFLEERGYPSERCAHPEPVSQLDGRSVLVTEFVEGAMPGQGGRSMVPLWAFEALGDLLGKLHAMTDLSKELKRPGGSWHGDPQYEGLPDRDIAAARAWLGSVQDRVPEPGREPYESLRELLSNTDACDDLPRALVHPDFVPVNAIATPGGRVTVVDWTGTGLGPRVASLANLLLSVVGKHEGSLTARVDAVVHGYRRHIELEDEELARLGEAMWIRPLLFGCFYYRSSVTSGYIPTGREPWWPDRKPIDSVARSARAAFRAKTLPRTDPDANGDRPKPEIPGQLSLDVPPRSRLRGPK
jgi:Ser/Thr protein kinase RdoA (MazF antagonist)